MLYAYDNGTEMEVVRAGFITSFKKEDGWWYLLDNALRIVDNNGDMYNTISGNKL